ncbi:MAG: helix-turn-helix transcriptional regulator [Candidatus Hodarchaeales archaeon]
MTNLTINDARLDFTILADGLYICNFKLIVSGNEYSSHGETRGNFSFPDSSINMTYLNFPETQINYSMKYRHNKSYCIFQSDLKLLIGVTSELSGSFVGKYHSSTSDLYTYHLGIDWGRIVGEQVTNILLDASTIDLVDFIIPESQEPPSEYLVGSMVGYKWENVVCIGFNGTFWVYPRKNNPNLLKISNIDWNVSINQRIEVEIQNIGSFNLNIEISTPIWIDCNETEFLLVINETRGLLFIINSQATSGLVDSVLITIIGSHENYPIDILEINVRVRTNINLLEILFLLFLITMICVIIPMLIYYKRPKIDHFITQVKKQVPYQYTSKHNSRSLELSDNYTSKSRDLPWESIKHRWESILPINELRVIEILSNFGSMNQQRLANHLGVSKVTMSRLISRLESKRLIHRERMGMSKIIRLNEEIL